MNYKHHIIRNFPEDYPFWKKMLANALFFLGGMVIHHRENWLNNWDFIRALRRLEKGDIALVGGLRRFSSLVIGDVVTHALIYVGRRTFVHSIADGVETVGLHDVYSEYDTMVILRPDPSHKHTIEKAVSYAFAQIGKPYDFDFEKDAEKFYCSELVYYAFKHADFDLGISKNDSAALRKALRPSVFVSGHFKPIFLSHNIVFANGRLKLKS